VKIAIETKGSAGSVGRGVVKQYEGIWQCA